MASKTELFGGLATTLSVGIAAAAGLACLSSAVAAPLSFASSPAEIATTVLEDEPGTVAVGIWRDKQDRYAVQRRRVGSASEIVEGGDRAAQPLFEIGSISKLFTGLLLAQAVERGDLSLDDNLGKLLQGQAALKPETAAITLRQLVTHSACLPREPQDFPGYGTENPFSQHDRRKLLAGLSGLTLEHAPPCGAAYSNLGMGLLGQLLADRYGKPWDVLVRENITGPLGMRSTFQFPGPQAKALAAGYSHEETRAPWDFDALSGAGALRSTAPDLLIFARAMMAGSAGPLGPAADRALTPLARYRGEEIGYAVLIRGPAGHRTYYHDGLTGGYRALLAFAPDTQEAAAVLVSNTHAPSYKVLLGITASRYPTMPAAPALAPGVLAEYGGIYQVDKSNYVTMVPQDGTLYRRTTGGGFRPLSPAGRDTFVDTEVGVQYGFRREAGEIVGLDYSQGGAGYSALRTKAAAPAIAVAPLDRQQEYVGRYRSERLIRTDLIFDIRAENGQLGVRSGNWLRRPVFPVAAQADRFVYENGLAQLQFERDAAGQVTGVVLYESGVIRLRRMP